MARLACVAGALLLVLGCLAAEAGSKQFDASGVSSTLPTGSFESAGVAVFVRAHEARRHLAGLAGSQGFSYSPVASGVSVGGPDISARMDVAMPTTTGTVGTSWVAPSSDPKRPGELPARDPVQVATPFARSGLLETHRTPDVELQLSKRATLGLFGDAKTIEGTDIRNSTVRTTRDVGAGVTLQYRFGP